MGPADAEAESGGGGLKMLILFTGLLSALLTRLQIRANTRLGLTAAPRADRWHAVPTPSSGGLLAGVSRPLSAHRVGGGGTLDPRISRRPLASPSGAQTGRAGGGGRLCGLGWRGLSADSLVSAERGSEHVLDRDD